MHEKVALKHSSKSTKYELESSYGGPLYYHFRFGNFGSNMGEKMLILISKSIVPT